MQNSQRAGQTAPLMITVSGCRGIVGASLTPEVVCRFAGAFAGWLGERGGARTVVIGRDGRRGGDVVAQLAIAALRAAGLRVVDLGVATTATVGVMVTHHAADGGLVVTASHNPAEWNGLKAITREGCAPPAKDAAAIIERYRADRVALAPSGQMGRGDADATAAHVHVARVLDAVSKLVPLDRIKERRAHVALDSVNASGALGGRMLLEALGCRVTAINAETTGDFPHAPEPTKENLVGLCGQVKAARADVGFAQDPDADRLAIIDERGGYIGEEQTLVIGARPVLKAAGRGATVAVNLSTSRMIDDVAKQTGARVVRSSVGEANVVEAMVREKCVIGGEGNGGVIWPPVALIRDSLGAMALTLAAMAQEGCSVSALTGLTPRYAIVKRKVDLPAGREGLAQRAGEAVAKKHAKERIDTQDGVRVDFEGKNAWLHVRGSNTEPIMRLIAEAPTEAEANAILDDAAKLVGAL